MNWFVYLAVAVPVAVIAPLAVRFAKRRGWLDLW
jgi:hypothetical protein